jgi:hypothetical protein
MKNIIFLSTLIFLISGCNTSFDSIEAEPFSEPFTEIDMDVMDMVSYGGYFEVTVNSDSEYEELIYTRFQKPLDDYWNAHYNSVLQSMRTRYPGLTDEEYEELVREVFYSILPFRGTENWSPPKIDFSKYTLLGQDAHSTGCRTPDFSIKIIKNDKNKELIFKITITEYGTCETHRATNKWILISKIDKSYKVRFEKEYIKK